MKRKKLIIFSGPYPIDSLGATRTIDLNLAKAMAEIGYQVTLIACGKCSLKEFDFIEIETNTRLSFFERLIIKLGFKQLTKFQRTTKVDKWVASYLSKNSSLIDEETVFIGRAGMSEHSFVEAKKKGALTVLHSSWMHPYTQNSILRKEYKELGIKSSPILKRRILKQLSEIEIVDKIWCISDLVYESYINNGVIEKKLFNISLGVDFEHYSILNNENELYAKRKSSFKILFVGQVNYEKGAHLLLESIRTSKLNNCEVIFNGSLVKDFKKEFYLYKKNLEKRNIKVRLDPGDPLENYKQASIFVLPSIHESFGLVVLEAMASGIPVIVSDNVGAKDCVVDEKTGFIFESHNLQNLKDKVEFFFLNRSEIVNKGKNASEIAKNYVWLNSAMNFKRYLAEHIIK